MTGMCSSLNLGQEHSPLSAARAQGSQLQAISDKWAVCDRVQAVRAKRHGQLRGIARFELCGSAPWAYIDQIARNGGTQARAAEGCMRPRLIGNAGGRHDTRHPSRRR